MGFIEELKRRKEAIIIDLPFTLEDDKPAQVKCRPVVPGELMSRLQEVGGVPIVQPGVERDLTPEEGIKLLSWAKAILKRSVFAIRVYELGQERWEQIELTDEEDVDTPKEIEASDGRPKRTLIHFRDFEFFDPKFIEMAANTVIVQNTNFGGVMAELGQPRFREG